MFVLQPIRSASEGNVIKVRLVTCDPSFCMSPFLPLCSSYLHRCTTLFKERTCDCAVLLLFIHSFVDPPHSALISFIFTDTGLNIEAWIAVPSPLFFRGDSIAAMFLFFISYRHMVQLQGKSIRGKWEHLRGHL